MKVWQTVTAGIIAWLVFLVATLPADRALALAPVLPGVAIGKVQGTLWHGKASRLVVRGVRIDDVRWRFRPWSLFAGRLEFGLRAQLDGKPLRTRAGMSFSSPPWLRDVQASLPAAELLYRLGVNRVEVGGDLVLRLDEVMFPPQGVPMFSGEVRWSPAEISAPLALSLGSATLTTEHDDTVTRGELVASGGALQVQADVVLEASGAYRLDATVRQNGTVPQAVTKFLTTFAEYQNGSYRLEWSDTL